MKPIPLTNDEIKAVMVLRYPSPDARLAITSLLVGNMYNIFRHINENVVTAVELILNDPIRKETLLYGDSLVIMERVALQCVASRMEAIIAVEKGRDARREAYKLLQEEVYNAPEVLRPKKWVVYPEGIAALFNSAGNGVYRVTLGTGFDTIIPKMNLMVQLANVPVEFSNNPYVLGLPEKTAVKKMTGKIVAFRVEQKHCLPCAITAQWDVINNIHYLLQSQGIEAVLDGPDIKSDLLVEMSLGAENLVVNHPRCVVADDVAKRLHDAGFQRLLDDNPFKKSDPSKVVIGFYLDMADAIRCASQIRTLSVAISTAIAEALK